MYLNLNDYELIYLYRENNEKALNLILKKYFLLINKIIIEKGIKELVNDSYQDSLIVLYKCINSYDMDSNCSFFNYFLVCLKRKLYKNKIKELEYVDLLSYDDSHYVANNSFFCEDVVEYNKIKFRTELANLVFNEILMENLSPRTFSKKYNVDIKKVYNTIYSVKNKIKNLNK